MISYLKGTVILIEERSIILNTGNIGYKVYLNNSLLSTLKEHDETELLIHSHIREDCFDLYGFFTVDELNFFKTMISINGIGPKAGLELTNTSIDKLKEAILCEDVSFISKTPGIGPKIAKRIILELKGKITVNDIKNTHQILNEKVGQDIIEAIKSLGYSQKQIMDTLSNLPDEIQSDEEIIKYFLKNN